MTLSDPVKQIINQFVVKFPLPVGEALLQQWTHKLTEQLAFSFPGEPWGHKASSPSTPHSKDTIAWQRPFIGWDIIIGAGTPTPVLDLNAQSVDLGGQYFEPVVAINWLAGDPLPPPVNNLEARVRQLELDVARMRDAMRDAGASLGSV